MNPFIQIIGLLFGKDPELRQIISVTLQMAFYSTTVSTILGIPLGVIIGCSEFRGKRWVLRITNTFMGLPPVVVGLVVYLLLSRNGPLGTLKLVYTVTAMVIAQVFLITPIIIGLTTNIVSILAHQIQETTMGMGLSHFKYLLYTAYECRGQLIPAILSGFGSSISEVGAVQIVGGNILFKTRVMTTAIALQTNLGNFAFAVALGVILLIISFIINIVAQKLQEGSRYD